MFLRVLWGLKACMLLQDRVGGEGREVLAWVCSTSAFVWKGFYKNCGRWVPVSRSSTKWRRTVWQNRRFQYLPSIFKANIASNDFAGLKRACQSTDWRPSALIFNYCRRIKSTKERSCYKTINQAITFNDFFHFLASQRLLLASFLAT